jgi:hypothetical protein
VILLDQHTSSNIYFLSFSEEKLSELLTLMLLGVLKMESVELSYYSKLVLADIHGKDKVSQSVLDTFPPVEWLIALFRKKKG